MLVFLMGAHGVGKTTTLHEIKKRTGSLVFDGTSRPVLRAKFLNTTPEENQTLIENLAIHFQSSCLDYKDPIFFARSVLDNLAYAKEEVPFEKMATHISRCIGFYNGIKDRAKFFYIPIQFELKGDAERPADIEYQKKIDKNLKDIFVTYGVEYETLAGDVDERAFQLLKSLGLDKNASEV